MVAAVKVKRYGSVKYYKAKREIILSAGAVGSPFILMHSGIGPAEHLKKLKVGSSFSSKYKLQGASYYVTDETRRFSDFTGITFIQEMVIKYVNNLSWI